jgi:hypothetical protein
MRVFENKVRRWGILKWGDVDWIHLAQVRDQWRTVVNTVLNLRAPYGGGGFLMS